MNFLHPGSESPSFPYADRHDAGRRLGERLRALRGEPGLLVLGLPRGGLPVAAEIAGALDAELDIVVVRKVGLPFQPEVAMGAIAGVAGVVKTVVNADVLATMGNRTRAEDSFRRVADKELAELRRRESTYRAGRPPLRLQGRTLILVDDGLATGATMRAALTVLRDVDAARIIAAVPVALGDSLNAIAGLADEVVCLWTAPGMRAVGQAYDTFGQTSDDEVRRILDASPPRGGPDGSSAPDQPGPVPRSAPDEPGPEYKEEP